MPELRDEQAKDLRNIVGLAVIIGCISVAILVALASAHVARAGGLRRLQQQRERWLPALDAVTYSDAKSRAQRGRDLVATEPIKRQRRYRLLAQERWEAQNF